MEGETVKTIVQVAGVGGLGMTVFFMIFREVIKKNIFPQLQNDHAYRVILLILSFTFTIALAGLGSWFWIQTHPNIPTEEKSTWDKLDGGYKLMLINIAKEGCFFFKWDQSVVLEMPDIIEKIQSDYVFEKISAASEQDPLLVVGFIDGEQKLAHGVQLSHRHAVALKQYLMHKFDLPPKDINTTGIGVFGNAPRVENYFCGAKLILTSELENLTKLAPAK